jgi:opacity protein-like surface antigen
MRIVRTLLLGTVVGVLAGGSVMAAEILGDQPEAYSSDFDWNGVYVGVGVSVGAYTDGIFSDNNAFLDVIIGANATNGDFLIGGEVWVGGYNNIGFSTGFGAGAEVRAGALVGDGALIYAGLGGYGFDAGAQYATVGLGVEFVVGDNATIDLEYKYWQGLNTTYTGSSLGASLNWYF